MSSICDDLRAAILQAAMQGKLTEQLSEDGTADELLEQIKAKKEKLIAEGKIKKDKPLALISEDDAPFEIPENWAWCRMMDLGYLKSGYSFVSSSYIKGGSGIQVVRISDLGDDKILDKDAVYYPESEDLNPFLIQQNSFLICQTGSIGKMAYVNDNKKRYLNQRVGMFVSYIYDTLAYSWRFLHSRYVFEKWNGAKTSTNGNIKNSDILELLIPIPPLAEQKRIVEKVDGLMARVDDLEKSVSELASLKKSFPDDIKASLLQAAMQGKLTEQLPEDGTAEELLEQIKVEKEKLIAKGKIKKQKPLASITDDEIPFEIPDNWKWVRLPEVADSMLGKTLNKSTDMGEEKPYLCSINIYWEGISLDKIKTAKFSKNDIRQYLLRKNDLLVCEGGDVGRAAIWTNEREMYYQNALHRIRFYGGINAEYMLEVLNCYKRMGIIEDYSKGVTIKHFVQTSLNKMPIPLPPLAEQKRIVEKINNLMSRIEPIEDMING